ncbi:hypothetical protein QM565_29490 [Geitlerinema splendidum]|nr:hypothetical protein [Geitlerinema splendidum]
MFQLEPKRHPHLYLYIYLRSELSQVSIDKLLLRVHISVDLARSRQVEIRAEDRVNAGRSPLEVVGASSSA